MTTSIRHALVAVASVFVAVGVAVVLLAGHAEARGKRHDGSGCRMAKHCQPVKGKTPTSQATPIAPGCVEYGPDCVIDLTTGWPTTGPVVIVQTFPCPLTLPETDPVPCEEVTTTTTLAAIP